MNFHETIQLQALRLKQLNTQGMDSKLQEHFFEQAVKQNAPGVPLKNICAHISQELFDNVDSTCRMLEISKRQFVEMALIEALNKAEAIVAEIDPFPSAEEH